MKILELYVFVNGSQNPKPHYSWVSFPPDGKFPNFPFSRAGGGGQLPPPPAPPVATPLAVGVLRGWGRAQITVRHFGSRGKKV